jgi:hypothetical protein
MDSWEQIQNRVCWTVAMLFVFSYVEANTGCLPRGFGICFAGFPAQMFRLSDAGGLRPFDWGVWGVNVAIGVFGFVLLVWLWWAGNRRRWVQYSSGALFAAVLGWANPIMIRLKPADQQPTPGFIQAAAVAAGFPFRFLSYANGLRLFYVFLNIFFGLVCLELIYRILGSGTRTSRPQRYALRRWAAIWVPLCAYFWVIERYGPPSTLWHRFDFAYFVTDAGLAKQYWWVAGTDILIAVLIVISLLAITTSQRANLILFVTGYAWANMDSWSRWYERLGIGEEFRHIGFPFPFWRWPGVIDLGLLFVNVGIGICVAYFIHRSSQSQNFESTLT